MLSFGGFTNLFFFCLRHCLTSWAHACRYLFFKKNIWPNLNLVLIRIFHLCSNIRASGPSGFHALLMDPLLLAWALGDDAQDDPTFTYIWLSVLWISDRGGLGRLYQSLDFSFRLFVRYVGVYVCMYMISCCLLSWCEFKSTPTRGPCESKCCWSCTQSI